MKFREKSEGPSGKLFLRLKSGESVRGVFRGDIEEFGQHWSGGKSTVCVGKDKGCPFCLENEKPSFRFRLNFMVNENGAWTAKVFEQGWVVYEALRELHKEYDLEKHTIKITRKGEGTDTTYHIVPTADGRLAADQIAKISQVKLNDLRPQAPTIEPEDRDADENFGAAV